MHIDTWGAGPSVVLVHGAITNGPAAWSKQQPLADRWQLRVVTRPGFVPNPPAPRSDFETDARHIAALLDEPAHLVGHSYGGLVALLAAARRPDRVRSLALLEPAVMSLLRGDEEVERAIADHASLVARHGDDPREFLAGFTASVGGDPGSVPDPLPAELARHVELLINERPPWEATIPVQELAAAPFPTLVVSGGHSSWQERMCDALAAAIGPAASRARVEGAGHRIQRVAAECNARLAALWLGAEAGPARPAATGRP